MILAVNKDLLIDCNYDSAAALLKRAEGIVTLTICNPNKDKKDDGKLAPGMKDEKKPEKPVEPEAPPPDPAVAPIIPNKEMIIELNANSKPLGMNVIGGKMLTPPEVCIVIVVNCDGRYRNVFHTIPEWRLHQLDSSRRRSTQRQSFKNFRQNHRIRRQEDHIGNVQ